MLARIVLDENKGILFCIKILSSYNRHLKNSLGALAYCRPSRAERPASAGARGGEEYEDGRYFVTIID